MNQINVNGYKRITKHAAKRRYKEGQPVLFCPVKLRPGGMWGIGSIITNDDITTFEQALNAFEYYNCCNSETGNYTAFYIEE